jgi:hypothetical protein
MKTEEIARLRTLLASATPGPWEAFRANHRTLGTVYGATTHPDVPVDRDVFVDAGARVPDVELIVAAVNALPELLDELDRTRVSQD